MRKVLPIQVWRAACACGGCDSIGICLISIVYDQNLPVALDLVGQPNKMNMIHQLDG